MVSVLDVGAYILKKRGPMSHMKLQKLAYYSQAWSLVWDDKKLFSNRIEAWANGPVIPELYWQYQGYFEIASPNSGDPTALDSEQAATVDAVLEFYGDKSAQWLSQLTHSEAPWKDARDGLPPGARSNSEITVSAMVEYYGSL